MWVWLFCCVLKQYTIGSGKSLRLSYFRRRKSFTAVKFLLIYQSISSRSRVKQLRTHGIFTTLHPLASADPGDQFFKLRKEISWIIREVRSNYSSVVRCPDSYEPEVLIALLGGGLLFFSG